MESEKLAHWITVWGGSALVVILVLVCFSLALPSLGSSEAETSGQAAVTSGFASLGSGEGLTVLAVFLVFTAILVGIFYRVKKQYD